MDIAEAESSRTGQSSRNCTFLLNFLAIRRLKRILELFLSIILLHESEIVSGAPRPRCVVEIIHENSLDKSSAAARNSQTRQIEFFHSSGNTY